MHNAGRPTDGSVQASGVQDRQRARGHRGGLHPDPERVHRQRPHRAVGHHGLAAAASRPRSRRATNQYRMKTLDSFHPFNDTPETANADGGLLRALLRDRGLDARRRLVRPGPAPARHLERARRCGRSATTASTARRRSPGVELVGRRLPLGRDQGARARARRRRTTSTCSTWPRRRGAAPQAGPRVDEPHEGGHGPELQDEAAKYAPKAVSSLVDTGDPARFVCPLFE